ncbi:MAG: histidine kinase [Lachnospiraceae bacterium]|nr:histidine kinase [Lachnospiraceae bacterium]
MKNHPFRSLPLKQKLRRLFLLTSILYIIFMFVLFIFLFQRQSVESAQKTLKANLLTIGGTIRSKVEKVNAFTFLILMDEDVQDYLTYDLKAADADEATFKNLERNALASMRNVMVPYDEVCSVYVVREDLKYACLQQDVRVFRVERFAEDPWRSALAQKHGKYVVWKNGDGIFNIPDQSIMSMMRVYNDTKTQEKIGYLSANFYVSELMDTLVGEDLERREYQFLDHNGLSITVTGNSGTEIFDRYRETAAKKGTTSFVTSGIFRRDIYAEYAIPETDMTIVCVEHFLLWENLSYKFITIPLASTALMLAALLWLDAMIRRYVTRPIRMLSGSMQSVKKGLFRRASIVTYDDEIGMLKDSYNEMMVEMNRLIHELLEKEETVHKTEINVLQQQIKPHFLYNTIEMIASLAVDEDTDREQVYDALETLGSFYRQFLSNGSNEVSLATEIEIAKKYLKLQKLRYGEIFEDVYEIDESCLSLRLPKLTIQPIIENSLYHGIRPKGEFGTIRIRVFREGDEVHVELYDNGVGMRGSLVANIMKDSEEHFGLRRTIERFCYFEKRDDCYTIESKEGEYTQITLVLRDQKGD